MSILLKQIKNLDWGIMFPVFMLVCFGLIGIYSTCLAKNDFLNLYKQIGFVVVGFLIMLLISFFDYRLLRNNSYLILILYGISLFLLVGVYFFAPIIRGTKGWYQLGILTLDPNEPTKIILLILLAKYFSMRHVEMYKFRNIIFSGLYVFFPALLIFIKPDLGGATILVLMWIGILLISGIKINHFLILSLCFILVASLAWIFILKDYQKERITSFIFPYDYLGSSWSQNQTKISIGSGKIFGQGMGNGSQVQYGFLPEPHTDFIFSVLAHEWGIVGVLALFTTYGFLIWNILKIAIRSESNFPRLFASGFVIMLVSRLFINVGMNLSLLPVVGISLPFVSYGGSGLIGNFISLGILQSFKVRA